MSGNTIGGIVGGAIGFWIGGPAGAQWGWMIGSAVGGIVDPQTIQGAQWQNQQLQGSSDGLGRAVIFGTATVTGNLLDAEPGGPRIGKKTESGKGGPEIERDTAILTYAVEICDSSELRGTKVNGVIAVWEDEKLVYDVRPDQNGVIAGGKIASSQKWLANKTFYFGGEDQMPPPELEAIHGSGNVPAYRGSCIMVVHDEDLMVDVDDKPRGRIPTYRFLVSACAPVLPETPAFLVTGQQTEGLIASCRPLNSTPAWMWEEDATMSGIISTTTLVATRGGDKFYALVTGSSGAKIRVANLSDLTMWSDGPSVSLDFFGGGEAIAVVRDRIWFTNGAAGLVYYDDGASSVGTKGSFGGTAIRAVAAGTHALLANNGYGKFFASYNEGESWSEVSDVFTEFGRYYSSTGLSSDGSRFVSAGISDSGFTVIFSDDYGENWNAASVPASPVWGKSVAWLGGNRWMVSASDGQSGSNLRQGFFISTDNAESFTEIDLPEILHASGNGSIAVNGKNMGVIIVGVVPSTEQPKIYYANDETLENWQELPWGSELTMVGPNKIWELNPLSHDAMTPVPDSPGYYVDGDGNVIGPDSPIASLCGAPLDQVVRKLHKLGAPQLSDDEFDLEPLGGDIVRGYAIQDAAVTAAEACDPLRRVWTFDLVSHDGQIHAIKRGRDVDWTLPEDDLIAMDSDYEQSMQDDTVSLPRKLHLAYSDLNIDYKETTQISERYSTDVRVVGEEKISMGQLVMTATEAKQAVVKQHKLAWLNAEDTRTLSAPLEYIGAVNSDIVQFRGRRYRVDQMRVEGLQVTFESAAYDRASSYQSTAVGTEGVPPPPMGAALRGPTVSVFMNLPVLRDADDKAGIYWAASGLLEGWRGALLQTSRDGTTFENLSIAVPTPCTIGTLQAGILSASRYGMDEVNQIMVKLNPLSPGLDSTDMDGLLREANSAAILYADGTAEIVQFLTAVETAPREYTLSGLLRGRLDTTPGAHNAGAQFVLLNDAIRFVPLRNDDVGATITFRAMSAGTVAENNDSVALTLGSFKSLAEWEPAMVRATTGTNEVSVTWAGRGRLGSSRMPVHSLNFDKYRVRVTKSGTTATAETGNQYATVTYTGISEPYTTGVTALSRIDAQFNSPEGTA